MIKAFSRFMYGNTGFTKKWFCFWGLLVFSNLAVAAPAPEKRIQVLVLHKGIHTELALPVKTAQLNWQQYFPAAEIPGRDTACAYVAFSWGDRRFFLETPTLDKLRLSVAFSAAFWPTPGAMHVRFLPEPELVKQYAIWLTPEQYRQLSNYITASFKQQDGRFIPIPNEIAGTLDNYYEAWGRYSVLRTCNSWTNNALKETGLKTAQWALLPAGVRKHLPYGAAENDAGRLSAIVPE